ncbi:gamma-glutamylcyclotransferase [Oceanidesulfovibrio indonesiensis]|uniref:Gamma-glutamylcyclotransferase n=1 Tax=Oceanidesulfovibrio indonesiensis TaxID=54767 RepID=A0A7M3MGK5_9BACT|nr:gamma-glutamylcyclotransferase family protein [Oceanidesulfovibrio indonesiensis]TVM18389.1 gamma-glutamylcyclotransferase [Oceanidesulfovibrio indonesiensis]
MSHHPSSNESALRVFVYGTLKHGYGNHFRLCLEYLQRIPGLVRGRVVDRPEGFPTLFVPMTDILAAGTPDMHADCRLTDTPAFQEVPAGNPADVHCPPPPAPWRYVAGEIYTFGDGTRRLRELDMLEDFIPNEPSMYCRVVLRVHTSQGTLPCWAYISPHSARFEAEHAGSP